MNRPASSLDHNLANSPATLPDRSMGGGSPQSEPQASVVLVLPQAAWTEGDDHGAAVQVSLRSLLWEAHDSSPGTSERRAGTGAQPGGSIWELLLVGDERLHTGVRRLLARGLQAAPDSGPSKLAGVRWVPVRRQATLAQALNAGVQQASAPAVAVLAVPVQVEPGWLASLLAVLEGAPAAAAVGPVSPELDGWQRDASGSPPGFRSESPFGSPAGADSGSRSGSFSGVVSAGRVPPGPQVPTSRSQVAFREAKALSAACLLLRREALDGAEPFDPAYCAHYLDADLSVQLRLQGYHLYVCPDVRVRVPWALPDAERDRDRRRFLRRWRPYLEDALVPGQRLRLEDLLANDRPLLFAGARGVIEFERPAG